MIWIVSRHAATVAWLTAQGIAADRIVPHLGDDRPARGDTVIGTLPADLYAALCASGVRCLHVAIAWPEGWRGRDLSAEQLAALEPRLIEVFVEARGSVDPRDV